jgi:hypothetical protein
MIKVLCDRCNNYEPMPNGTDAYHSRACKGDFGTEDKREYAPLIMSGLSKRCRAFEELKNGN